MTGNSHCSSVAPRLQKRSKVVSTTQSGLRAVAVDLVDDDDDLLVERERLLQDESGLGHRALDGVDEEEDAVDHVEDALDLTAEVSVSRCVDDVDLRVLVRHRGVLGEDGDPALALEIVAVHDARLDLLVLAEHLGLREHRVDERGLAVVDVRDDGDVSDFISRRRARRHRRCVRQNRSFSSVSRSFCG